jgi:hypothetical protein
MKVNNPYPISKQKQFEKETLKKWNERLPGWFLNTGSELILLKSDKNGK